jgi:PTH1 family peptidyl-tRNA hydrolase
MHRSFVGEGCWGAETILLVQPGTFMNHSGEAVAWLRDFYHLPSSDFVVVHDDMDLAIGRIRGRENGGAGGHRGIESIIVSLGTKDFFRVKIGIGRPPAGQDPVDFVLQPFTPAEEESIFPAVEWAVEAVEVLLAEGPQKAMSMFNIRSPERA